jgi:hypothetical protein
VVEVGATEGPVEGSGGRVVMVLKSQESVCYFVEVEEIVWGEGFALDD